MSGLRGRRAYRTCLDCGKPVRVNKPVVGSVHVCVTDCEKAGLHLAVEDRRAGPFWARRTDRVCTACGAIGRGDRS